MNDSAYGTNYENMSSDRQYPPQNDYLYNQQYQNQYDQPYSNNPDQMPTELVKPQQYQDSPIVNQPDPTGPTGVGLSTLTKDLAGQARKSFIKKVYMTLGMQLLITAGMCFLSYFCRPFLLFQIYNQWLMWVCFGFMIVTEIIIFCCPAGRKHPINIIMLLIFTLCESYTISYICAIVAY